jgi:hypothetical protein
MFTDMQNATAIKRGKCVYNISTEYEVRIVKWHVLYGTGDHEDPPEVQNDRNVECYYVFYEDLIKRGVFNTGGGSFLSIEEAIASVENKVDVKWLT